MIFMRWTGGQNVDTGIQIRRTAMKCSSTNFWEDGENGDVERKNYNIIVPQGAHLQGVPTLLINFPGSH